MPGAGPFINTIHTDKLLSEISVKYSTKYNIAEQIFPVMPVKNRSDLYRIHVRNLRVPVTVRANGGEARTEGFEVTTSAYRLVQHALKGFVTDDDQDNYDAADLRVDMTEQLTDKVMRRLELDVSNLFTTTGWSQNVSLAAAGAWTANTTVSDPIAVIDTGTSVVITNSGMRPNFIVMSRAARTAVKNHISVLDRVKYTSAEVSDVMLARLMDVDQLLVSDAGQDTSLEGVADSVSAIWGNVAFLGYKPARPTPLAPSSGYLFMKNNPRVRRWREDKLKSEVIEVELQYDARIVASLSGYLIKAVT